MSRPFAWRLAGGAPALAALLACAPAPTDLPARRAPRASSVSRACASWALPTYALVDGRWRVGGRAEARTLYMEGGVLRVRRPARVDATLDLRGLELAPARGRVADGDEATFVARRDETRAVALTVTQGCVTW